VTRMFKGFGRIIAELLTRQKSGLFMRAPSGAEYRVLSLREDIVELEDPTDDKPIAVFNLTRLIEKGWRFHDCDEQRS
jgi:hypothetical protein